MKQAWPYLVGILLGTIILVWAPTNLQLDADENIASEASSREPGWQPDGTGPCPELADRLASHFKEHELEELHQLIHAGLKDGDATLLCKLGDEATIDLLIEKGQETLQAKSAKALLTWARAQ